MDAYEFGATKWTTVEGGMQQLPKACLAVAQDNEATIKYNCRVTALEQASEDGQVRQAHTQHHWLHNGIYLCLLSSRP